MIRLKSHESGTQAKLPQIDHELGSRRVKRLETPGLHTVRISATYGGRRFDAKASGRVELEKSYVAASVRIRCKREPEIGLIAAVHIHIGVFDLELFVELQWCTKVLRLRQQIVVYIVDDEFKCD